MPQPEPTPTALDALREKWAGRWKIWRARRDYDAAPTGSFMATRIDPEAGPWPTVMEPTPADLDRALREQAVRAAQGIEPLEISSLTEPS